MAQPIPVLTFQEPLTLQDLRYERGFTQEAVAENMGVGQTSVLKLERRADLHLSTLARFIDALGGRLVVLAEFPAPDNFVAQIAIVPCN